MVKCTSLENPEGNDCIRLFVAHFAMCCLCDACKCGWRPLGITTKKEINAGCINFTQLAIQWKYTLVNWPRFCTPFCQYCLRVAVMITKSFGGGEESIDCCHFHLYLRVQSPESRQYFTKERSEGVKYCFYHKKIKFISSSHV